MASIDRSPPKPPSWDAEWGTCRWCGDEILKPDGTKNTRRRWHERCNYEYAFARNPAFSTKIIERDGERCKSCNTLLLQCVHVGPVVDPSLLKDWDGKARTSTNMHRNHLYDYMPKNPDKRRHSFFDRFSISDVFDGAFSPINRAYGFVNFGGDVPAHEGWTGWYSEVEFCYKPFNVDHIFPLWLVDRTKPFKEIIKYWLDGNLQTLCEDCHKAKSKAEAAERAKMKRIQKKQRRHKQAQQELPAWL